MVHQPWLALLIRATQAHAEVTQMPFADPTIVVDAALNITILRGQSLTAQIGVLVVAWINIILIYIVSYISLILWVPDNDMIGLPILMSHSLFGSLIFM